MYKGKRNSYECNICGVIIITMDVDEGVTPFTLGCRGTIGCRGLMQSACYSSQIPKIKPHYVWRKPTPQEYKEMGAPMKSHIDQGGLDLHSNEEEV